MCVTGVQKEDFRPPSPSKKVFSEPRVTRSIRTALDLNKFQKCGQLRLFPSTPFFTLGFITAETRARSCAFKNASRTQVVLEAVTGFVFQTALSYPHRIPRPECGYAEGHRQHHYPTGRHGDYKVRLCFQLSSTASPHPRLSLDAEQQQQQDPPSERLQLVLCIHLFLLLSFLYELFFLVCSVQRSDGNVDVLRLRF